MNKKAKIGIFGSTGYTGIALNELLAEHPSVEIAFAVGSQDTNNEYIESINEIDLVFFATPNGIAHKFAPKLIEKNIHVIDLSADYRFRDLSVYEKWYGFKRDDHKLNAKAIYGLVEYKREEIKTASKQSEDGAKADQHGVIIGNPGCYTTASILAIAPILEKLSEQVDLNSIIIDGKSGYSGAGKKAVEEMQASGLTESCMGYKHGGEHRHGPELEVFFSELIDKEVQLNFSPHIIPVFQGLLVTCYVKLKEGSKGAQGELKKIYLERYKDAPLVEVLEEDEYPKTHEVAQTNKAQIQVSYDEKQNLIISTCAIDNLIKGAAGQAIQNMNLILNLEHNTSLL